MRSGGPWAWIFQERLCMITLPSQPYLNSYHQSWSSLLQPALQLL